MPLSTVFIDLNAYFASVEQQLRPELRGKPVGVVAVDTPSTCCLAASYEAKRLGVKTGMLVGDARRLCPQMQFVLSRPEVYVRVHHQVIAAVDSCTPVSGVHSIDEVSCRLWPGEREPAQATVLALKIKRAIATRVGEHLKCSIGVAPNRFLAKVGTDMMKPDGLVVIEEHELPDRLFGLDLIDLPGIGRRMKAHLEGQGITTVRRLCELSETELAKAWGSIVGRTWWHWLRGREVHEPPTRRRSIGHQHVLPPESRRDDAAYAIAVRLLHKAAARARHLGYWARRLSVSIGFKGAPGEGHWGNRWHADVGLGGGTQDTLAMVGELARLWRGQPPHAGVPMFVGVTLHDLVANVETTLPLFEPERRRGDLAKAIDRLNDKYGRHTVYSGAMHGARESAPGGIAFSNVPDLGMVDSVGEE